MRAIGNQILIKDRFVHMQESSQGFNGNRELFNSFSDQKLKNLD
jgi:hypothetical protein